MRCSVALVALCAAGVAASCGAPSSFRPNRGGARLEPSPARASSAAAAPSSAPVAPRVAQLSTKLRVRISGLPVGAPARAAWRQGGEGLGGAVRRGDLLGEDSSGPLRVGEWSAPVALADILPGAERDAYFTLTAGASGRGKGEPASRSVAFEVQQYDGEKLVQELRSVEADGGTLTLFVPGTSSTGFLERLATAGEVAEARRLFLAGLAGTTSGVLPRRLSIVSDLGGYGEGSGYGIRVSDRATVQSELGTLLELGVTGLRAAPPFVLQGGLPSSSRLRARVIGPVGYPSPEKRREPAAAGCPFAAGREERARLQAETALSRALQEDAEDVWVLTVDEIGAVTDLATEGKAHLATCPRCRAGFVAWLKQLKQTPAAVGANKWSDVAPLGIWGASERRWLASAGLRRRAYLTRRFLNVASASMFSPLRDALAAYNAAPKPDPHAPARVISYALRPSTFSSNGSSLDMFEFYRYADNAIVWETSNRDARAWGWDAYTMDVQRVVAERYGLSEGIYVKPHRGAVIQRALSAVARGNDFVYWYTYGPDYWKGDAFSADRGILQATQRAAELLGVSEPWLLGARLAVPPRVAVIKPETTLAWANLSADPRLHVAQLENAKWVYTALQHGHVPVDALDEELVTDVDLSRYRAIYVNGSHVTARAAAALERYVHDGGTVVTIAGGLSRDEADEPLRRWERVLGVKRREPAQLSCPINTFRAVRLEPLSGCAEVGRVQTSFDAEPTSQVVGSEALYPEGETEVLAHWQDGAPAMLKHRFGKGQAYLLGTFAGLEYAAPVLRDGFDMTRDFTAARRSGLLAPIAELLDYPVRCSSPLLEPQLLRSADGSGYALSLVNWAYAATDAAPDMTGNMHHVQLQPSLGVKLEVFGLPTVHRVYSAVMKRELPFEQDSRSLRFELERVDEADAVRLE
ncbi:MAG: hypothetical protein EOO73_06065 [Myxococcales bacterium]|nr:MAG: hypothetical protein EOO73_06065 [Myxococcales bacterium]